MSDWPEYAEDQAQPDATGLFEGIILPWYSTTKEPPKGWGICDGQYWPGKNGKKYLTPDLTGAFLRGAKTPEDQTKIGTPSEQLPGSNEPRALNLAHSHGGSTGGPTDNNRIRYDNGDDSNGVWFAHAHSIGSDLGTYNVDVLPKHWSIRFIIKLPGG